MRFTHKKNGHLLKVIVTADQATMNKLKYDVSASIVCILRFDFHDSKNELGLICLCAFQVQSLSLLNENYWFNTVLKTQNIC